MHNISTDKRKEILRDFYNNATRAFKYKNMHVRFETDPGYMPEVRVFMYHAGQFSPRQFIVRCNKEGKLTVLEVGIGPSCTARYMFETAANCARSVISAFITECHAWEATEIIS